MKKSKKKNQGFSLIELLIVVAIILIIAAIAIPNLLRARRAANEGSATASMRTVGSGELLYRSTNGQFTTLTGLSQDSVIDGVLGSGSKSGFTFAAAGGTSPTLQFTAIGVPSVSSGATATGNRTFFTDETQVIRFTVGNPPSAVAGATDTAIGN